jgi:putative ABC transport system permease protein
MFKNYIKQAYRNLIKNMFHTLTNIIGLGFGLACCILIFIYIQHELSFNRYHENSDHIYRIAYRYIEGNGDIGYAAFLPDNLVEAFRNDIPQIRWITPYRRIRAMIGYEKKKYLFKLGFADPEFLKMFTIPFIAGFPEEALDKPQSVLITRSSADKMFGTNGKGYDQLIGESLEFPQRKPNLYVITGVIEDLPDNSTMDFEILAPWVNCHTYPSSNNQFGANMVFIQLHDKRQAGHVENIANSLIDTYWGDKINAAVKFGSLQDSEDNFKFFLQPLEKVYLHSDKVSISDYEKEGNLKSIYILSSIAVLILFIACINYIMLTIGQSMNRMKRFGLINIVGAHKSQITRHFITESFIVTLLALFLGIVFAEQLLPVFNRLAQRELSFFLYRYWQNYFYLAGIVLFIVLVTSTYVTLSLYRINHPLSFLRGETKLINRYRFARIFVTVQYMITIVLMISGIMIIKQLNYFRNRDVGFNDEHLLTILVDFEYSKIQLLKDKFREYPNVLNVSSSDRNFVSGSSSESIRNKRGELIETRFLRVDPNYANTLGLEIINGRNFRENNQADLHNAVLVNETLIKAFGFEEPLGEFIINEEDTVNIIGVVKDFHFDSMKRCVMPVMLHLFPYNSIWYVFVRIAPHNISETISGLKESWEEIVPEYTFDYSFLDEILDDQYNTEERWSKITGYASFVAIFLSCLGLLGISSLLVVRRVKEIGIRKVNGGTLVNIILLLYRDILKWVVLAFIIACPFAWLIISKWLQNFAYHTTISWWIFGLAGGAAVLISLITITWQSYKAANTNPVECLRHE